MAENFVNKKAMQAQNSGFGLILSTKFYFLWAFLGTCGLSFILPSGHPELKHWVRADPELYFSLRLFPCFRMMGAGEVILENFDGSFKVTFALIKKHMPCRIKVQMAVVLL